MTFHQGIKVNGIFEGFVKSKTTDGIDSKIDKLPEGYRRDARVFKSLRGVKSKWGGLR